MNHEDKMAFFEAQKKHQLGMGGKAKLDAHRTAGKLNVRERLDYFFDQDTFQEIGLFTHSERPETAAKTPTDGKIIGFGRVQGRLAGTVANDLTILGASSAPTNMKKIEYMRALSCEKGLPLVFLGESTGARMPDTLGARAMAIGGQNPIQYRRLREAPWISVLLGPCFGSSSLYAVMSDITIMHKEAVCGLISAKMTQLATGEDTPIKEMAGWEVHAQITGMIDAVGQTEPECMDLAKKIFGYLPLNADEPPPRAEVPPDSGKDMPDILKYLPEQPNRVYDMRKIIRVIVDGGEFVELKADFARACTTGLARLGGDTVAVVANNPRYGAGALDAACCEKISGFLVLCDSYNIPIVTFVDTPGFIGGQAAERRKIVGKLLNWMNALSLVTVPRLTVVVRKDYGQAYLNMGGGRLSDVFVAWPTADISFTSPEPAINVVFNVRKEDDPDRFAALLDEVQENTAPYPSAGVFGLNEIIDPPETRDFLIRMLGNLKNRLTGGIGRHQLRNWPTTY